MMINFGILGLISIFLFVLIFLDKKANVKVNGFVLKSLSIILFGLYFYRLFQWDIINYIYKFYNFFSGFELVFVNILRWLTMVTVVVTVLNSFLKVKTLTNIQSLVSPLIILLDIIFFQLFSKSITGIGEFSFSRVIDITFACELVLMGAISGFCLYKKIAEKDWTDLKGQLKYLFICLPLIMLMTFPLNLILNLFGFVGVEAKGFNLVHRIYIYISFLVPILVTVFAKNKPYEIRNAIVCLFAFTGFTQYFYTFTFDTGVTGLPFHLCNTAILLMFVAFLFKWKPVFYFTYLVNVVGSLFAILLPNCSTDIATLDSLHFWFNHWYAFFVPLLGVTLKIFKRPNFKMVRGAIYIFTLYLIFAALLNGWLSNYDPEVDYFFLNRNFIIGKFPFLYPVKINFILTFRVFDLFINVYWLYDIVIYLAYVLLIFIIWVVYAYCYKVFDHYQEVALLNELDILEIKNLKQEMGGRKVSEPLDEKGIDSLQIKNFSKRYGASKDYSVRNFNLEVKAGEVFGFLGHNGSGKSTTIKSIVGINSITEGQILVCGYDIARQPLKAKMQIGYVSDNHAVYEHLTGREYVNYIADLYHVSKEDREKRIKKYVEMFNLVDSFDSEIKSYSHGMKQKVMVISSLIHNPKVWILDEPLTGLDPASCFQIKECMREHAKNGNIVFFSSHVIEVVEKVCDRIAIICKGELKGVYDIKKLKKAHKSLEDIYMQSASPEAKENEAQSQEKDESTVDKKSKSKLKQTKKTK